MAILEKQLRLISSSFQQVLGKIYGEEGSDNVVIFCHGFGVMSDSRGMYNHLAEEFKNTSLTIRLHFVKIDSLNNVIFTPAFSSQLESLKTVVDEVFSRYSDKKISIVGHSQGCYIVSMLLKQGSYSFDKVVLISPSIRDDISTAVKKKLEDREGSELNIDGVSKYIRTDGSVTLIPKEYWEEASKVDCKRLFKFVEDNYNTFFIWPTLDTVRNPNGYSNLLELKVKRLYELEGDHDLKTDNWFGLTNLLKDILKID